MNKSMAATVVMALLIPAVTPAADDVQALLRAKSCNLCHNLNGPRIGPSFQEINRRFHGLHNAREMLVREVQNGTDSPTALYHWGDTSMPPDVVRKPVSPAEAEELVDYILSIK